MKKPPPKPWWKWLWDAVNLVGHWRAIDEDSRRETGERPVGFDWRVLVVLLAACVTLTVQEYIGDRGYFDKVYPWAQNRGDPYWHLKGFGWWAGWRVVGYLVFPMLVVLAMPREKLGDYHLSLRGFFKHLWVYVVLFVLVAPAVWLASKTRGFQHTYPFYKMANRSDFDFWAWEMMYWAQFLSLEFFFRGFLLQGLRRALGANAIFVMIVPYTMIHYGKPMPETFGAIFAGIILGTLAMRTRSIWGGVLIHVGVATMMDVLAVGHCSTDPKIPCSDDR
jgi:membrane protease YdiL (CAAX protease family)